MASNLIPNESNKEVIRVHNAFINAIFTLSADAKKLLLTVWLHTNNNGKDIKIYRGDIIEKVGIDLKNLNSEHREKMIEELMKTIITIRDIENPNNFIKVQLLGKTKYKDGVLYTNIDEDLLPYIKEAQEKLFTRFKIQNIKPLTSSHAIRIYLMLKQYEDTGWKEINFEEFKKMLELEYKYKNAYDLKRRVLEVAKKQINENTDIEVDYELIKKGRKYKKIKFAIRSKNKEKKLHTDNRMQQIKNDFNSFRQNLIKSNTIIALQDKYYEIKDGYLWQNDKLLNKEEAFEAWQELYKNKNQIKIIDNKKQFEAEREENRKEQLKKELLRTYFGKKYELLTKNAFGNDEFLHYEILKIEDITFKEDGTISLITFIGRGEDGRNYRLKATLNQLRQYTK